MNHKNKFNFRVLCLVTSLVSVLASCAPSQETASPTSIPPQPTNAEIATLDDESSMLRAGLRYKDASGDMPVSFLDVVAFQAAVNEETETLEVVLQMRDIPPTVTHGQITNLIEYIWTIFVHLDPSEASPADIPGDYYLGLNTTPDNHFIPGTEGASTPMAGEPVSVPINELFENKSIYSSAGRPLSTPNVIANPEQDILIITGRVPGIKSDSVFSFTMSYNESTTDRPDNYVSPELADQSTLFLKAGLSYSDASGDMAVSFLDVVAFQAAINEETEILEVLLQMRDVPPTATHRQIRNVAEYMWEISIFTDPSKLDTTDVQPDYYLFLMTVETDPPTGHGILEPGPGNPKTISIDQIWDAIHVNNQQGDYISGLTAVADPELDTITMRARIPGINSDTALRFATIYFDGTMDRPDNNLPSESAGLATLLPEVTQAPQTSTLPAND